MGTDTELGIEDKLKQAFAHRDAGDLGAAESLLKDILKAEPQNASAQKALHKLRKSPKKPAKKKAPGGKRRSRPISRAEPVANHTPPPAREMDELAALYSSRKLEAAEKKTRKLIKSYPKFVNLHNILGAILGQQDRVDEAVSCLQRAAKLEPGNPETHGNLGNALRRLGRLEEAAESYRRAVALNPDLAETHFALGSILKKMGSLDDAADSYRRALAIKPQFAEAQTNLGNVLLELGCPNDAVACHRKALAIRPDFALAYVNLGNALSQRHRLEAIASYRRALELAPNLAQAHAGLGDLLERDNKVDEAAKHLKRALELAPDDVEANLIHARLLRRNGDFDKAIALLKKFAGEQNSPVTEASICFELGLLYDRAGSYDAAFSQFTRGNSIQSQLETALVSQAEAFRSSVHATGSMVTREWVESWTVHPEPQAFTVPAFLVGFPRSGTTLLDQMLDAHPKIQVLEEANPISRVNRYVEEHFGTVPQALAELSALHVDELRKVYFDSVDALVDREPSTLLVDKLPLHICNLPTIHRLFPSAKIILAMRHPCDAVLSNFMQRFEPNVAMSNFFTLSDAAALYGIVMGFWQRCEAVFPLQSHMVRYESIVADRELELRPLLDFLGTGWDDSVLDHSTHAVKRGPILTPSYQSVTEPIYQRAKYRWTNYAEMLAPVLPALAPFIEDFGYESPERP